MNFPLAVTIALFIYFRQAPKMAIYGWTLESFCSAQGETKGIKDFISVLMFYRDHPASEVEGAVELALENHIHTSAGVHHVLIYTNEPDVCIAPLANWPSMPPPDVTVYGQLGGVK